MIQTIQDELFQIEQREHVRILYAAESGSRAWGFASPDSDYDVRFIYVRPEREYLRLDPCRDVIERPIDNVLDVSGWDLPKALRLLHKSNPSFYEWMASPIVYRRTEFVERLRPLLEDCFIPRNSVHHYLSMARRNREGISGPGTVRLKSYFYILRPLLACRYVRNTGLPAPVPFRELVEFGLPASLHPTVDRLLEDKQNAPEKERISPIPELDAWIAAQFQELEGNGLDLPEARVLSWTPLNDFFWSELSQSAFPI